MSKKLILWRDNQRVRKELVDMLDEIIRLDTNIKIRATGAIKTRRNVKKPYFIVHKGYDSIRKAFKITAELPDESQSFFISCNPNKVFYIKKYIEENFTEEAIKQK